MSDRIHQAFVSSTYEDLKDERQTVIEALIEADCFPSGMEMFAASDEDQWEMIKSFIDACDYYIILSAGRYGSLDDDGLSFTEKEYDYALAIGKPVATFMHANPFKLPGDQLEQTDEGKSKLRAFQKKLKTGKIVKSWKNRGELKAEIVLSLNRLRKTRPSAGWVRADQVASIEVLKELNDARTEIEGLKSEVEAFRAANIGINPKFAWGRDVVTVDGTIKRNGKQIGVWAYSSTWTYLFSIFSRRLMTSPSSRHSEAFKSVATSWASSKSIYNSEQYSVEFEYGNKATSMDDESLDFGIYGNTQFDLLCQFQIHNLVELDGRSASLTEFGLKHLTEINAREVDA